jgi:hypothetical protein
MMHGKKVGPSQSRERVCMQSLSMMHGKRSLLPGPESVHACSLYPHFLYAHALIAA